MFKYNFSASLPLDFCVIIWNFLCKVALMLLYNGVSQTVYYLVVCSGVGYLVGSRLGSAFLAVVKGSLGKTRLTLWSPKIDSWSLRDFNDCLCCVAIRYL